MSSQLRNGAEGSSAFDGGRLTAHELARRGELCRPLSERLKRGRERAAFDYLARETHLDVVNAVIGAIPDQQLTEFLVEQILQAGSLLSSEAYTGVEHIREELRVLGRSLAAEDPKAARARYDARVERLGQLFFALGRRLQALEDFMASCPLTGSAEQRRGRYGQRARDLAGDVAFMRQELTRWVRRFVPVNRGSELGDDPEFLEARLDAVVDELGLRLREVLETLNATLYEQLLIFDPKLTRKRLFRGDVENVTDVDHLLAWAESVLEPARAYDRERRPEQLEAVKSLLQEFDPEAFLAVPGLRESDQSLFLQCIEDLRHYEPSERSGPEQDPVQPFVLLVDDFVRGLHQRGREERPPEDPFR